MALPSFTPSAYGSMAALYNVSTTQAIPGGAGTVLLITNLGPSPAVVLLGGSTVAVTLGSGLVVLPNQSIALSLGANAYIAAQGAQGTAILNLAQGI